jgi:ferredoxin-type protein NapF
VKRSIDRFQFLRGDFYGKRQSIRPPWAKSEANFINSCQRCDACIEGCPEQILKQGQGGFPVVDFSLGACTFCAECVKACTHQAFEPSDEIPWQLQIEVLDQCLSLKQVFCRSCGDTCEASAIRFKLIAGGRAEPLIDHERCNGCGECFAVCPNRSISILPSQQHCAA